VNREGIAEYFRAIVVPRRPMRGNDRDGHIYFITDGSAVKIGFSEIPRSRIADIQACSPSPLTLIAMIKGRMSDEQKLHVRFHAHRLHGEWFKLTPELRSQIAMIQEEEDNRTEFDAYLGWYEERRGTFAHPLIERQAFHCSRDVEMLRMNKGVALVRKIVGDSLERLGMMISAERDGTFKPPHHPAQLR
jgi:hypothetical protein